MVTILPALRQVREDLVGLWDRTAVEQICRGLGYRWRDRRLDPYTTLHLFILQVLHQNTTMTHLPHLAGGLVADARLLDRPGRWHGPGLRPLRPGRRR